MSEAATSFLTPWANFYIMTGSSAAALTGLMFVVITLVSGVERLRKNPDGISMFSTPILVHFGAVLFVSATLSAPWHLLIHPAALLAIAGIYGVSYVLRIMHKARTYEDYRPDAEDWMWYSILPLLAYAAMLGGAIALLSHPLEAMFALASSAILLTFAGIRNAWDIVTYITIRIVPEEEANKPAKAD